jgi:hypothetical protein
MQEITLSYVPKLVTAAVLLLLLGAWMLGELTQFAISLYHRRQFRSRSSFSCSFSLMAGRSSSKASSAVFDDGRAPIRLGAHSTPA